jgi:hypothetical protein
LKKKKIWKNLQIKNKIKLEKISDFLEKKKKLQKSGKTAIF